MVTKKNTFEIFDCVINLDAMKIYICVNVKNQDSEEIGIDTPEYLHQLQNSYFALTGKELEVNL